GKLELMFKYTPILLVEGIRTGDWSKLEGALQLTVPPFSLAFGLAAASLGLSLLMGSTPAIALALFILASQALYMLSGLAIMPNRSVRIYLALLCVPWFIVWK